MYANARSVFDHTRSDLDQALTYRCELSLGQRTGLRNGGAHAMHEPERRGVEVMLISEVMPIAGWDSGQHWGQQIDGFAMLAPPTPGRIPDGTVRAPGASTALLAQESQFFLDHLVAGFEPNGSWSDSLSPGISGAHGSVDRSEG